MSELVLDGTWTTVDISAFRPQRFAEGQPIKLNLSTSMTNARLTGAEFDWSAAWRAALRDVNGALPGQIYRRNMKKKGILERLKDGSGSWRRRLSAGTRKAWLGASRPVHARSSDRLPRQPSANCTSSFAKAGAEVLQALTFYASRDKLATVGLEDRVEDINRSAVRIAKEVAGDEWLVAGNLSLTWMYEPDSPSAADRVRQTFDEQLAGTGRRGRRLHHRRNVLVAGRGSARSGAREENRIACRW